MPRILPRFIKRDGEPQIPPPYSFQNVTIRSFRLQGDGAKLTELVDKQLNLKPKEDQGFWYVPLGNFVYLDALIYERMEAGAKRYKNMGYIKQNELYFRIKIEKFFLDEEDTVKSGGIGMFVPYIFVNNNWSVLTGREVLGYPKVPAIISIPALPNHYPITMSTDVFENYGPEAPQTHKELIRIDAKPGAGVAPPGNPPGWPWGDAIVAGAAPREEEVATNVVHLKQILDAENHDQGGMERACYQALVDAESNFKYNVIAGENPFNLPPARITINDSVSLSIRETLGLGGNPLNPIWEVMVRGNLKLHKTRNLIEFL